jgi:hypothetical protein
MKRFFVLLCGCVFFLSALPVFSQENLQSPDNRAPGIETDPAFVFKPNQAGDQFLRVSLMVSIPAHPPLNKLFVGGAGLLGYMRFLTGEIAIGGDLSFEFHGTVGSNALTLVPFPVFKFMYQPVAGKFEFPLLLGIGGIFETYLDKTYFGLLVKPEAGAFYRITTDWSVGLMAACLIMPQWYSDKTYNYTGIIPETGITARFHF